MKARIFTTSVFTSGDNKVLAYFVKLGYLRKIENSESVNSSGQYEIPKDINPMDFVRMVAESPDRSSSKIVLTGYSFPTAEA